MKLLQQRNDVPGAGFLNGGVQAGEGADVNHDANIGSSVRRDYGRGWRVPTPTNRLTRSA
jgi:hypothetical protein